MDKETLGDKFRDWVAGVAFAVYLWAIRMTKEEFWAAQDRDARQAFADEMDKEIASMSKEEILKAVEEFAGMWADRDDLDELTKR